MVRATAEGVFQQNGSFALRTDFAQIPTPSTVVEGDLIGAAVRRTGRAGMVGHRGGFLSVSPIFKYAVMPVARTLSPATRESHQPDAA